MGTEFSLPPEMKVEELGYLEFFSPNHGIWQENGVIMETIMLIATTAMSFSRLLRLAKRKIAAETYVIATDADNILIKAYQTDGNVIRISKMPKN